MTPDIDNRMAKGIRLPDADLKFLIWGGRGWVAGHLYNFLKNQGKRVSMTTVRMEGREAVLAELEREKPTHVLNCAGVTGRPNVDWCEDNREVTIRSNVIGTLNLADCCYLKSTHCTVFATGCKLIFRSCTLLHSVCITQPLSSSAPSHMPSVILSNHCADTPTAQR